jgi:hypothetical protein
LRIWPASHPSARPRPLDSLFAVAGAYDGG